MSETTTSKKINLGQLSEELGNAALVTYGLENAEIMVVAESVTQTDLDAAVQKHIFNTAWVDIRLMPIQEQTALEKLASVGLTVPELKAALGL